MSKAPYPRLDALRAMREAQAAEDEAVEKAAAKLAKVKKPTKEPADGR